MAKRGPKKTPFDWNMLEALAGQEASCMYVAEYLLRAKGKTPEASGTRWKKMITSMTHRIVREIKDHYGLNYVQFVEQKRDPKRIKLRQLQWKSAEAGNVTMQIWLGKQMLGQSDKQESTVKSEVSDSKLVIEFKNREPKE